MKSFELSFILCRILAIYSIYMGFDSCREVFILLLETDQVITLRSVLIVTLQILYFIIPAFILWFFADKIAGRVVMNRNEEISIDVDRIIYIQELVLIVVGIFIVASIIPYAGKVISGIALMYKINSDQLTASWIPELIYIGLKAFIGSLLILRPRSILSKCA